jgi:hypothetical protein
MGQHVIKQRKEIIHDETSFIGINQDCQKYIITYLTNKGYATKSARQLAQTCKAFHKLVSQTKYYVRICDFYGTHKFIANTYCESHIFLASGHGNIEILKYHRHICCKFTVECPWTNAFAEACISNQQECAKYIAAHINIECYVHKLFPNKYFDKLCAITNAQFLDYLSKNTKIRFVNFHLLMMNCNDNRISVFHWLYTNYKIHKNFRLHQIEQLINICIRGDHHKILLYIIKNTESVMLQKLALYFWKIVDMNPSLAVVFIDRLGEYHYSLSTNITNLRRLRILDYSLYMKLLLCHVEYR